MRQNKMISRRSAYTLTAIFLFAVSLRLIGIGNPLIGHHSWRQADTAAVSRNFVEEQFNILHPKIDWRGTTDGDVECEFPIYQILVAGLYRISGVNETVGRLLSVAFSMATIAGVFLLSSLVANPVVGLWSAFFMAILPMPIFYGRAFMPESLLLACCVYSVLLFTRWTKHDSLWDLFWSLIFLTIACLIKPPTLYLGLPLAYLAIQKQKLKTLLRLELWVYALVLLAALALWYLHAHHIRKTTGLTFGVWEYGSDKWGNWDLVLSWPFWERILIQRIPHAVFSYTGLFLFIIGLRLKRHTKEETALVFWLLGILIFVLIVARGVFVHDYYLLPATVPAAYFMSKAAAWGLGRGSTAPKWARVSIAFCVLATVTLSLTTYHKWLSKEDQSECDAFQVALTGDKLLPKGSLVIAADRGDPMILYYSHKKGWRSSPADLTRRWIHSHTKEGARYILGVHEDFIHDNAAQNLSDILVYYLTVTNNGRFFIVSTRPEKQDRAQGRPEQ